MEEMDVANLCLGIITVLHSSIVASTEEHKDHRLLPILHDLTFLTPHEDVTS